MRIRPLQPRNASHWDAIGFLIDPTYFFTPCSPLRICLYPWGIFPLNSFLNSSFVFLVFNVFGDSPASSRGFHRSCLPLTQSHPWQDPVMCRIYLSTFCFLAFFPCLETCSVNQSDQPFFCPNSSCFFFYTPKLVSTSTTRSKNRILSNFDHFSLLAIKSRLFWYFIFAIHHRHI